MCFETSLTSSQVGLLLDADLFATWVQCSSLRHSRRSDEHYLRHCLLPTNLVHRAPLTSANDVLVCPWMRCLHDHLRRSYYP